jgi:hypothetical protein
MNDKAFDGRKNFAADDEIERMLEEHFATFGISHREVWRNFAIYTRRVFLKRFLALYELYQMVVDLPGDVVELGVYRGASLMAFANFMEIRNMGDRHRCVFGFDNFQGFGDLDHKDGAERPDVGKKQGGFASDDFEAPLRDAIRIFDADRFIPYKARIKLIKGNIEETVPAFVAENPGVRICLLHFDADLYRPTVTALEHLWPLVVPGGVVAFDEYGIPPWEGESRAVDEFFRDKNVKLQRFSWTSNPGAYLVKG